MGGSAEWPECPAAAAASGGDAADPPRAWWRQPGSAGGLPADAGGAGASAVDIDALGAVPAAVGGAYAEPAAGRRAVRARVACCVCARLHWSDELRHVYFWRQPEGAVERSFLCDEQPQRPPR